MVASPDDFLFPKMPLSCPVPFPADFSFIFRESRGTTPPPSRVNVKRISSFFLLNLPLIDLYSLLLGGTLILLQALFGDISRSSQSLPSLSALPSPSDHLSRKKPGVRGPLQFSNSDHLLPRLPLQVPLPLSPLKWWTNFSNRLPLTLTSQLRFDINFLNVMISVSLCRFLTRSIREECAFASFL